MEREKGWNLLCKFFDNLGPIPHHMHQSDEQAKLLGRKGKPEAYYFPPQYNETDNNFPYTFMGLEPGTTKADVRRCLENWNKGDNGITFLSRAYRLEPGTGWQIDPAHPARARVARHLRAAGEQRRLRDVPVGGRRPHHRRGSCWSRTCLPEYHKDLDYIVDMLDWDANVNPNFGADNQRFPKPVQAVRGRPRTTGYQRAVGLLRHRLVFREGADRASRSGRVTIKDSAAYGIILTQGYGTLRHAAGLDAVDDPLRTDDGRRAVRHGRRGRATGVQDREPERRPIRWSS